MYSSLPTYPSLIISTLKDVHARLPHKWAKDKLSAELWSKQIEIMNAVRDHRRVAVHSCHRIGKSYVASLIAFWWIDTHEPGQALVVTSAHSSTQVKMALWREMNRVHSKGKFPGRMNQTEYWYPVGTSEEMVAFGRKPADEDPSAFQGTYSPYVLFILDEACYVPTSIWNGADTLIGNELSKLLALGNPDDPNTEFGEVCKPGSGWHVIGIGHKQTPNFSGEPVSDRLKNSLIGPTWVAEKKIKWGEDNPLYISKVDGEFPDITTDGLIPIKWIHAAQERLISVSSLTARKNELGVDVGGGKAKAIIAHRLDDKIRIIHKSFDPNTMNLLSAIISQLKVTKATVAKVDMIGVGKGIVDRAEEISKDKNNPDRIYALKIKGVNVGSQAIDTKAYINLRAEGYWTLRERFESLDIDPDDEDLAGQLVSIKYRASAGRIQIESKEEIKAKGKPSPDEADAVMLSYLDIPGKKLVKATVGS